MSTGALPGFRDFYPERVRRATPTSFAPGATSRAATGSSEYDGPPLEPLDLYTKKSGDEIVGQLYNFTDKGGREVALRPEMTPTLARMVAARANALRKPVRWFSVPQLFRYERQQKGRLREHFQLNVDIVGEADVAADAELLAVALEIMRALGLGADDVRARVSDRRLLTRCSRALGVPRRACARGVSRVIDKIEREPRDSLAREARRRGRGPDVAATRCSICHVHATTSTRSRARFGDDADVGEHSTRFDEYSRLLDALGVARLGRARSLDRARARVLHGDRLRAVRREGRVSRDLRRRPVRQSARRHSAGSICPRLASGWAMSCSASCCAREG